MSSESLTYASNSEGLDSILALIGHLAQISSGWRLHLPR